MPDLDRERADLNALIREAHECIKDLHSAVKTTEKLLDRADTARKDFETVMSDFDDKVEEIVVANVRALVDKVTAEQLDLYVKQMMEAIAESEKVINARFDRLTELLMFEEDGGQRIQGLTLPDYIAAVHDFNAGIDVKVRPRPGITITQEEEEKK